MLWWNRYNHSSSVINSLTQWFPNQLDRNMNAQEIAASGDLLGAERGNINWANWANDESISNNCLLEMVQQEQ